MSSTGVFPLTNLKITCSGLVFAVVRYVQSENSDLSCFSSIYCYKTLPPSDIHGLSLQILHSGFSRTEGSAESKMWTQKIANKVSQHQLY